MDQRKHSANNTDIISRKAEFKQNSSHKQTQGNLHSTYYTSTRTGHISGLTDEDLSPSGDKKRPMMTATNNQINPELYQKNGDDIFDMPDDGLDDYDFEDDVIEEDMDEMKDDLESISEKMADLKIFSKSSLNEDLEAIALARRNKTLMGPNFDGEPCIHRKKFFTEQMVYLNPEALQAIKKKNLSLTLNLD